MMRDEDRALIRTFLKRLPVFRSISEDHLDSIVGDFSVIRPAKEETIFYQSDQSTDLYIVLKGSARASLLNQEGQELLLTTFKPGDFFGEMSLLDGRPRSATIIADEDSLLGVLKREVFLRAVQKDPMIAIDLLSALVQRLRAADEMIESLAFLDVSQRLVKLLLQLAREEGAEDKSGAFRVKKYTHKDLATRVGASREAVSKVMKVLMFKKTIREDEGHFVISPDAEQNTL